MRINIKYNTEQANSNLSKILKDQNEKERLEKYNKIQLDVKKKVFGK